MKSKALQWFFLGAFLAISQFASAYDPILPDEPVLYVHTTSTANVFVSIPFFDAEVTQGTVNLYSSYSGGPISTVVVNDNNLGIRGVSEGAYLIQLAWMNGGFPTIQEVNVIVDNTLPESTFLDTSLPVELMSFDANVRGNLVHLAWETASEVNFDYFALERSTDASNFQTVATLRGTGSAAQRSTYAFTDKHVAANTTYYYRLKQIDKDDKAVYSRLRAVQMQRRAVVKIAPNIVQDQLTVFPASDMLGKSVNVHLYDLLGQKLCTYSFENNAGEPMELNLHTLNRGNYVLVFELDEQISTERFVKL